jgi:alpha-L-rhamnosidase
MKRCLLILLLFLSGYPVLAQQLTVTNLRCESRSNPLGMDMAKPGLSWELQSKQQNVVQTAYRILVADNEAALGKNSGNIWDSKKINSSASVQVVYAGKTLQSTKKYFWKVMVWDNKGNVSVWSTAASWQMGLLTARDWKGAKWIGYDEIVDSLKIVPHMHLNGKRAWGPRRNILPMMRKEFLVEKPVKAATIFICGLGHFELSVNGEKTGDHFLDPGWTNYSKHAQYVSFDITRQVKQGANAMGVMLGNGFYYIPGQRYRKMTGAYGHPKMIMLTVIEYADGQVENIISDQSWQTFESPIIFSSIFGGEDYDATKEQPGWDKPGFLTDGKDWFDVIITNGPEELVSQLQEPVKIMERFPAGTQKAIQENVWIYDLGQNFSGIPFIMVSGHRGDTVRIICAELLNADGTANQKATGSPSYFTYILKGEAQESWQPKFSYTGFRYLQVQAIAKDGLRAAPVIKNAGGLHIRNATATTGSFQCSNELFNRTHTLIDWAIKSNMVSLFTDCPHREKLGWLEQTHLMGASVHYRYDAEALNRKMLKDMEYAQYKDGKIPEIAPEFTVFTPPFDESPEWGSAAIILPWYNYQWYGDKRTLAESYAMMKAYLLYLESKATDHILTHGLGDWFDIGPKRSGFAQMTKIGVTGTATFYYDLTIMIRVAELLQKKDDLQLYKKLAAQTKAAFNKTFFDEQKLQYDSSSQTANAMALYMGLVEEKHRQAVTEALIREIKRRNNALTAGDIGYRYVLKALEQAGCSDVIFDMNYRDDVPGYGFQLKHGATALTESWQAYESVSNNHFMLGHLMEWFYGGLAGIRQMENSVGYKNILIKPEVVGDLSFAKADFQSPYGLIATQWEVKNKKFVLQVTIPPNTMASVYLPGQKKVTKIGSGKYTFQTTLK